MENEILNYLKTQFNKNLKIEVDFIDYRIYKVKITINEEVMETDFKYDFGFIFETTMAILIENIKSLILKYYVR